jgi:RHS repeat-associated protein
MYFSYNDLCLQVNNAFQNIVYYESGLAPAILQARQLTWDRLYFWDEAQQQPLALSQISSRALVHHDESATFTKENITEVFGTKITDDIIQNYGGYFPEPDKTDPSKVYWWNRGLVQNYFGPDKPTQFYLPTIAVNSFVDPSSTLYTKTQLDYDAPYFLMPVSVTEYINDTSFNQQTFIVDYQSQQYKQYVDINNNVSQVLFDPLGQVIVSSFFGNENGNPTGGMRLYDYNGQAAEYILPPIKPDINPFDDILADPSNYLQGAISFFYYNLFAFINGKKENDLPQPASAIHLQNENYFHGSNMGADIFSGITSIEYWDGFGRSIEKKLLVDSGLTNEAATKDKIKRSANRVFDEVNTPQKWLVSGRIVYNNKAKPCEEYLPYFSYSPYYEKQDDIVNNQLVVPPRITHYDSLLRVIRIDTPKGFFSKVEFSPWEIKHFDEDDTVTDSAYYIENYPNKLSPLEKDAIDKAKVFYNTPSIETFCNTGHTFLSTELLADGTPLETYYKIDIQGRIMEMIDPRLYESNIKSGTTFYNFRYMYPMGENNPIYSDSVDSGIQTQLFNIFGKQLWSVSARNYYQFISYDRLQRRTDLRVQKPTEQNPVGPITSFNIVEQFFYGEDVIGGDKFNLRGQLRNLNDLSGSEEFKSYSLLGSVLLSTKQLVKEYAVAVNWANQVEMMSPLYQKSYSYDALNKLLTETAPDGTITTNNYNIAGQLLSVRLTYNNGSQQPLLTNIVYNEMQQRSQVTYANGVITNYTYETTTQRLIHLISIRPNVSVSIRAKAAASNTTVQDISYTYDPVGNITYMVDNTAQTVFNNNQQIEGICDYEYNAIYQIISATGRQHPGLSSTMYQNNASENEFKQCFFSQLPSVNDSNKLEKYTETYSYDHSGNLISKAHSASLKWVTDTQVEDNSNHLKGISYDESGNMLQLQINNPVKLSYNCCENLVRAMVIERPGESDDCDYYVYDVAGRRSRKVSERMVNGGAVTQKQEKIYLGNFEVKQNISVDASGNETVTLIRQTLRVMDDTTCIAIVHYWVKDDTQKEVPKPGTRRLRYQMNNNLGSVSLEMDDTASLISYEEYFPYGGTALIVGYNQLEVSLKDYRYSGKECDDSTGLYYYGRRYYVSWLGRWINPDPSGTADGLNLYAFVGGNPIAFCDPNGLAGKAITVHGKKRSVPKRHAAMNTEFEKAGEKIGKEIAKNKMDKMQRKSAVEREARMKARRLARKFSVQDDIKIRRALAAGLAGSKKEFDRLWRNAHEGMDEHLSTASVFNLLKGIGKHSSKFSAVTMDMLEVHLRSISHLRTPTRMTGYRTKQGTMQHSTGKGAFFGSTGENHGYADRIRREGILADVHASSATGFGMLTFMGASAERHTLGAFMGPATSSSMSTLPSITSPEKTTQIIYRDLGKQDAVDMGAPKPALSIQIPSAVWNPTFGGPLSPRRGPAFSFDLFK